MLAISPIGGRPLAGQAQAPDGGSLSAAASQALALPLQSAAGAALVAGIAGQAVTAASQAVMVSAIASANASQAVAAGAQVAAGTVTAASVVSAGSITVVDPVAVAALVSVVASGAAAQALPAPLTVAFVGFDTPRGSLSARSTVRTADNVRPAAVSVGRRSTYVAGSRPRQ